MIYLSTLEMYDLICGSLCIILKAIVYPLKQWVKQWVDSSTCPPVRILAQCQNNSDVSFIDIWKNNCTASNIRLQGMKTEQNIFIKYERSREVISRVKHTESYHLTELSNKVMSLLECLHLIPIISR